MVDTRHEYNHVFDVYVPIAVAVWVIIALITGFALWRYRARRQQAPGAKTEAHVAESLYAAGLTCIAAFLVYVTFHTESKVDPLPKRPGLVVDVSAGQWNWRFTYPRYGFTVLSGESRPGTLVLPANTELLLHLRTSDVVHSFWVPATRIKKDAFPDAVEKLGLSFPHTGTYRGQCAEYCGLHHADMSFTVRVVTPAQFSAWARSRGQGSAL